jgi:hypothetical protein
VTPLLVSLFGRTFHPAEESDGLVEKDRAPHCRKY